MILLIVLLVLLALLAHEVGARRAFVRRVAGMKRRARVAVACAQWPDLVDGFIRENGS